MGDIWLPQWERVDLGGPIGAPYSNESSIKLLWHRWEGTNWSAAESAFSPYPPHCAAKIGDRVRQYVPLDEHSYALLSSQSEHQFVVQVEVSGFSRDSRGMSQEDKEWLALNVLEPILFFHDIPDIHPPFYDEQDGFTLAAPSAPQRFSPSVWAGYSGHVGHQHAPAPDEHWDPGCLDVDTIIRIARSNGNIVQSGQQQEEDEMQFTYVKREDSNAVYAMFPMVVHQNPKLVPQGQNPIDGRFMSVSLGDHHGFLLIEELYVHGLGFKQVPYNGGGAGNVDINDGSVSRKVWVIGKDDANGMGVPA